MGPNMAQPVVAVDGRVASFGECIRDSLLSAFGRPYKRDQLYVSAEYVNRVLNLRLCEQGGAHFEHSPQCPAQEFNSPDPNGTVRVAVATVLEKNGRVLITKRHPQLRSFPDVWVVPGGHIEENETLSEAARRELVEETGLSKDIKIIDVMGIWESVFPHRAGLGKMTRQHAVCYMHAISHVREELLVQSSEVQSIAWLTRAQVEDVLKGDTESMIEVFQAHPVKLDGAKDVDRTDAWHIDRSHVSSAPEMRSAHWVISNMTAGTRFALRLWLDRTMHSSM